MEAEVKIKICGLTRQEDAETAIAAGADLVGFVFVPGTPRAVTPWGIAWARSLQRVATVGVFRDARLEEVFAARDLLCLDWVQLHGHEPDSFLDRLGPNVLRRVDWSISMLLTPIALLAVRDTGIGKK